MRTFLVVILAMIYLVGFVYTFRVAYRKFNNDPRGTPGIFVYNASGALGAAIFWFICLPAAHYLDRFEQKMLDLDEKKRQTTTDER